MTEKQLNLYDRLINEPSNDWDIYYWATGTGHDKQHKVKNRMTWADLSLEWYPGQFFFLLSCSRLSTQTLFKFFQSVQDLFYEVRFFVCKQKKPILSNLSKKGNLVELYGKLPVSKGRLKKTRLGMEWNETAQAA